MTETPRLATSCKEKKPSCMPGLGHRYANNIAKINPMRNGSIPNREANDLMCESFKNINSYPVLNKAILDTVAAFQRKNFCPVNNYLSKPPKKTLIGHNVYQ